MKPKKVVLLYGGAETLRSVQAFILRNYGYRVIESPTLRECRLEIMGEPHAQIESYPVEAEVLLEHVKVLCARRRGPKRRIYPVYVPQCEHESEIA